jgi:hypothetical protein
MTESHPSFCRMCHSACPILVDVEDGVAVKVSGDPSSEIYHGYTCIKGRALAGCTRTLTACCTRWRANRMVRSPRSRRNAMDEIAAR